MAALHLQVTPLTAVKPLNSLVSLRVSRMTSAIASPRFRAIQALQIIHTFGTRQDTTARARRISLHYVATRKPFVHFCPATPTHVRSAAAVFSAIIRVGEFVLPEVMSA
jgi:hypothetical protein